MTNSMLKRLSKVVALSGVVAAAVVASPCAWAHCGACAADAKASHSHENSLTAVAEKAGNFQTLLAAAKAAGLAETLSNEGPFTVFAPTDEAFAKLPEGAVAGLLAKPEQLKKVLLYHVVAGKVPAEKALTLKAAPSLFGQDIPLKKTDKGLMVGGAKVVGTDVMADNGIIHVIDTVLMPGNIVDVASTNDSFKTLTAAVKAAGLVDTLAGEGPFTVFAPTDEAFAKLPAGTVESLLKEENLDKLRAILTAHVVPGAYTAADVAKLSEAKTVQGMTLPLEAGDAGVKVADAKVVAADVPAFNGVIHVIDTVILPKS